MANQKTTERKKHKKEREKHEQKLKRQAMSIKARKEEREKTRLEFKNRPKLNPIKNEILVPDSDALTNIENNLQILKALEEQYILQEKAKDNLKEELEAEGFNTIEEKLEALKLKAQEKANQISQNSKENVIGELKSIDDYNDS
jgi:hypothetical protein